MQQGHWFCLKWGQYPTTVVFMAHELVTLPFIKGPIQGRYSTMPILIKKRLSCEQLFNYKNT